MAHAALFMGEIGETIEDMREIKGTDTGHPKGMFDAVFAIDALEHNRNVEDIMLEIRRIVKKGGTFIVCGPTENILYRIGRKFYGDSMDMSSEENSHFCTIDDIQRIIQKHFSIEKTATIPFGLPESISFFKIIKARNA
jgi:2-polyprenyl-3-methyl-5-hydroxy-6-metoxy-1,4-benzoquinol methylase